MILKKLLSSTLLLAVCLTAVSQNEHCNTPNEAVIDLNSIGKCAIENFKNSNKEEFLKVSTRNRYVRKKNAYISKLKSNLNSTNKASVLAIDNVDHLPLFSSCTYASKSEQLDCFKEGIQNHVIANLNYPLDALSQKVEDNILTTFTINSNGFVKDVKAKGSKNYSSLESEAKRIISNLPQLKPAEHNGQTAEVSYNFYINFKLADNSIKESVITGSETYISEFIRVDLVSQKPVFVNCSTYDVGVQQECIRETIEHNILDNLTYPFDAAAEGIDGTVWVRFIINEEGYVSNITASGPTNGKLLEEEAERLVKLLPKFIPGKHNNEYVNVEYFIPIDFHLDE